MRNIIYIEWVISEINVTRI